MHGGRFDLLLGRRTYDMWSGFWPKAPSSSMVDGFNAATRYIVTTLRRSRPDRGL
jgi:dihydrofolate reductase